jgi:hypothetical protein
MVVRSRTRIRGVNEPSKEKTNGSEEEGKEESNEEVAKKAGASRLFY